MKLGNFFKRFEIILLVIIVAVGAFLYWRNTQQASSSNAYQTAPATRGTLTASVGATGTVRAGQSATLVWQTSGRIEKINVALGDTVKVDAVLASLVQTSMSQNVILAQADLINAKQNLEDLLASKTNLAKAEQTLANAKQAVSDAQDKVDSISYDRASENLIQQTAASIELAKRDVTLAEDHYKLYAKKPDGDANKAQALLDLTNARQRLTDLTNKYNWYTGGPSALDAEKYKANLALAQAQMEDAQREVDRLINGPTANDIAAAEAKVAAAQSTLNTAQVSAPFNGIITQANSLAGDLVSAGDQAFRIDDISHLLVDLQISEVDINSISLGQPVTITFDAVQGQTYNGKVTKIGQAGTSTGTGVNFTVTVELDQADNLVKPGMTAAVNITVRQLDNVLLIENRAVRQINGKRVVYILENNQPVAVEVRLGATSDTTSEVIGGSLKEGELVILNVPTSGFGNGINVKIR